MHSGVSLGHGDHGELGDIETYLKRAEALGVLMKTSSLPQPTQPGQVGGHEALKKLSRLNFSFSTEQEYVSLTPLFQLGSAVADQTTVRVGDRVGVELVSAICGTCGKLHLDLVMLEIR